MRVVLTGGPCSGKSSVIRELEKRNYLVMHEIAREIIKDNPNFEFGDLERAIFAKQLEREQKLNGDLVFLDRGLPDVLAYCKTYSTKIKEFEEFNLSNRYERVFVFDRLPFIKDDVRYETHEEAERVHNNIIELYVGSGYRLTRVPVMPVEKRTDFVLGEIAK